MKLADALLEVNPAAQDAAMIILGSSLGSKDDYLTGYANLILGKTARTKQQKEVEQNPEKKVKLFH
ncbi:hypothetical protein NIES2104_65340 [Leptolyngbya sp. NIES-2104]|nr:hypothetical protein NIES2104_65340 [Leptolyngbya sp. NIES-2104]